VVLETDSAEQPVILEYVEPLVEYSKLTVPEVLVVIVAVMVSAVPTTTGDGGETAVIVTGFETEPGVTLKGSAGLVDTAFVLLP
jgi:hypothetical protein